MKEDDQEHARKILERAAAMRARFQTIRDGETDPGDSSVAGAGSTESPFTKSRKIPHLPAPVALTAIALITFILGEIAMTLSYFTGTDINEAKYLGQATVESCETHGPIGQGFGYWDDCVARVVWSDGTTQMLTPQKRGFFDSDEIGTTVTVGYLGRSKSGKSYARKERPPRPFVTFIGVACGLIALLFGFLITVQLVDYLRRGFRWLFRRQATS